MSVAKEVKKNGYAMISGAFSQNEISLLSRESEKLLQRSVPGTVRETDGVTVRALHGLHLYNPFFHELCADARLLDTAQEALADRCYVHQSKLNMKHGVTGAKWPWHQDYVYWKTADNIANPRLINVALLLEDASMDNGPIAFIPRSHLFGDLTDIALHESGWEGNVSENLTYQISEGRIEALLREVDVEYFVGRAGDLLFFDPLLVHSSSTNFSKRSRPILIVTYNAVSNRPLLAPENLRPEFLCARVHTPLESREPKALALYVRDYESDVGQASRSKRIPRS